MRISSLAIAAALALATSFAGAAPELVDMQVSGQRVENGKELNMRVVEIERGEHYSTVEVTFVSGGSVSSSMFILRAMCAIARARNAQYFQPLQVSASPRRFQVSFPNEPDKAEPGSSDSKIFSLANCTLLRF